MNSKKVVIERGIRLRNLREKVGLSRADFAQQTGMSASTLRALELGDRELSSQKALLFSNLFSNLFSISLGEDAHKASFDFLYYGKETHSSGKEHLISEDARIQNDVNFFTTNPSYSILKISDNLMTPIYNENDMVGGRKIINKNQFSLYQSYICIIEDCNGNKYLRRIIKSEKKIITCCILNTSVPNNISIIEDIEAYSIAQAIWHWRLSEVISSSLKN